MPAKMTATLLKRRRETIFFIRSSVGKRLVKDVLQLAPKTVRSVLDSHQLMTNVQVYQAVSSWRFSCPGYESERKFDDGDIQGLALRVAQLLQTRCSTAPGRAPVDGGAPRGRSRTMPANRDWPKFRYQA